jgi:hypothetical protein
MNDLNENPGPTNGVFTFIDFITGRVGKITALILAIIGLIIAVKRLCNIVSPKSPDVQVKDVILPKKVKCSEWDNMIIKLKGCNCDGTSGLYVIFSSTLAEVRLKPPIAIDGKDCVGRPQLPWCWCGKKPVCEGEEDWEWDLFPPQLEWVGNPRDIKRFLIHWEVLDYDNPTKVIRADNEMMELINDVYKTP